MHISSYITLQVEMFSAFQHTLSRLSLDYCNITISALITLINHFPSLDCLDINRPLHMVDDEPVPPPSRPLIQELHVSDVHGNGFDLLDRLSECGPVFDEIIIGCRLQGYSHVLGLIVCTVGVKAKRLRLSRDFTPCMYITYELTVRLTKPNTIFLQIARSPDLRHSLVAKNSRN
ncbi:hypothetical protein BDM02DRAFT_2737645 [Thelephora ganbajun]|uniref:Uncharacterized protein n=1 Tax=Thelephora ganbajun TaxID=370292 RepID=A0ACB6ZCG6_THEGA|nr:hypothetical protein BDM02DRAFT_2737645 [Thelephora ganbajun]